MMKRRTDSVLIYSEYEKNRERKMIGMKKGLTEMLLVLTSGGGIATTVLGMEEGNGRELAMLREVLTKIIKEHEKEDTVAR